MAIIRAGAGRGIAIDPSVPLYQIFPQPFRELWLSWANKQTLVDDAKQGPLQPSPHCHWQRQRFSLQKVPRFFLQKLPVTRRRGGRQIGQQNGQRGSQRRSRRIHLRANRRHHQLKFGPRLWIRLLHPRTSPHTSPHPSLPLPTIVTRLIP